MPKTTSMSPGPSSPKRMRLAPPRKPSSARASASAGSPEAVSPSASPTVTDPHSQQQYHHHHQHSSGGGRSSSRAPSRSTSSSSSSSTTRRAAGGHNVGTGDSRYDVAPNGSSGKSATPRSEGRSDAGHSDAPLRRPAVIDSKELTDDDRKRMAARKRELSMLVLDVCQQPERARLCSFKEENETIDRRPVDPPPVIELRSHGGDVPDLMDSTSFFIRASLVAAEPTPGAENGELYATVKTSNGADATAGEVIQTPERLRHMDGKPGALCIFAKLSVRLPGVFRLKFTLYETAQDGLSEITHVVSQPFEVFSPKLFKGMHESTPLTRHLATQGLKIKLRTDSSGGKGTARRRASVASIHSTPQRNQGSPAKRALPSIRYTSLPASGPASAPPYVDHRRSHEAGHVWHPRKHQHPAPYQDYDMRRFSADEAGHRFRAHREGGDEYTLTDNISSRLEFGLSSPSSDLSAFSLGGRGRPVSASGSLNHHRYHRDLLVEEGYQYHRPHSAGASSPHPGHVPPGLGLAHHHSPLAPGPPEFALPRLPRIVPVGGPMDPRTGEPVDAPPMHAHPHYPPPPHHDPRESHDPRDYRDPRAMGSRTPPWHGHGGHGPVRGHGHPHHPDAGSLPPPPLPVRAPGPLPILPPIRGRSPQRPRPYNRDPRA